ncbi:MAG: transglycosylase domain-containing protein [Firmicutes bacterium]|nr:transglycosylase domain-containing protein [Bacillota bacterium]
MDYSQYGKKRNTRKLNRHTARIRNKASLLVLRITLSLVLIAGFALVGGGVGLYFGILANSPNINMDMARSEYHSSFIICGHTGEELLRLHAGHNHEFVYIDQIPYHVRHAFVAIEDERFFEHNGIDIRGIGRALNTLIESGGSRTEGASTITQQLIKNMLDRFESNVIYKLQEQYLAIFFERYLTEQMGCRMAAKDTILESYLNIINLGRSNYGVQAAAQFYYGVDVWDLTIAQAATIASITQNPSRFPPDTRPDANWARTQLVLRSMHRLGFITDEEFDEAMREVERPDGTMIGAVYSSIVRTAAGATRPIISEFDCFTNALLNSIRSDLMTQFNWNREQANAQIFGGGVRIYTTQHPGMQAAVDRVFLDDSYWPESDFSIDVELNFTVKNTFTNLQERMRPKTNVSTMEEAEAWVEETLNSFITPYQTLVDDPLPLFTPQPQAAFVLLDHHTGHVLALRGVRGELGANRTLNRATQSTRQPGSQLKTIGIFGPAFDMGIMHPGTMIADQPFTYVCRWTGNEWSPGNWWTGFRGPMTVRAAVYDSANVVSARATADTTIPHVGTETMFDYLRNMGITTLAPGHEGPAVALGGMRYGVRLIELAGAYGMVANGGMFNPPVLYTLVLGHDGRILLENPDNPTRVFRDTAAYMLLDTMKDTMTRGTGRAHNWTSEQLRRNIPIAGKTGTTQARRDLGFSGSTPYFTASIWMGNDDNEVMTRGAQGAHLNAWRSIMQEIHEGLPPRQFTRPADGRLVTVTVCADSGLLAGELCHHDSRGNRVSTGVIDSHFRPTEHCTIHVRFRYCLVHGLLAGPNCHEDTISNRVGINFGPEIYGGFPQGVIDGLVCHNCIPLTHLPWEIPNQDEGPPLTLWPELNLPIPPMPDNTPPSSNVPVTPQPDDDIVEPLPFPPNHGIVIPDLPSDFFTSDPTPDTEDDPPYGF